MNSMGIKELYGVVLKTTSTIEINENWYEENEPILSFDKIQIGLLGEQKKRVAAKGGYGNQSLILWEETKGMSIQLSEGVISREGMSILSNSQLLTDKNASLLIPYTENNLHSELEQDENVLYLKYPCASKPYIYRNGKKITNFSYQLDNNKIILEQSDLAEIEEPNYSVYYDYKYINKNIAQLCVGQRAVKTFLRMTGRMRVKDDQTGKETTCLVEFPKVELTSDLTMRLGSNVNPYVYGFTMMAHPVGERGNQYVCKQTFLEEDIDADI